MGGRGGEGRRGGGYVERRGEEGCGKGRWEEEGGIVFIVPSYFSLNQVLSTWPVSCTRKC